MRTFGQLLREQRELNEFSQAGLAAFAGLPASAISHFESDRRAPSLDSLRSLVRALNTSANYLLGLESSPHSEDYEQGYEDGLADAADALALLRARREDGSQTRQPEEREGGSSAAERTKTPSTPPSEAG